MPEYNHLSNYQDITEAIIAFGQMARDNGLNAGIMETMEVIELASTDLIANIENYKYGLRSIYCCSEEDVVIFDELFDWFWRKEKAALKSKTTYKNQSNIQKQSNASVVMLGEGKQEEREEESKNVSGANEVERLRKTDFTQLNKIESKLLEEIAVKLWKQMSKRLKRKMKQSHQKGQIDIRSTIRKNITKGGELIELRKRRKQFRKQRLIILLDVSGSMDKYSFFLLKFLFALRTHFEKIEAFVFSSSLIRITDYLAQQNLPLALSVLSHKANNWSSGTKIGTCFKTFNEEYAKRILNGQSTTIVLSDGLDTGKPEVLAKELNKIKLRTRQLIWLNPLKGMIGYEPIQKGMQAAMPQIDLFRSAHNLDSLLELENFLFNA